MCSLITASRVAFIGLKFRYVMDTVADVAVHGAVRPLLHVCLKLVTF